MEMVGALTPLRVCMPLLTMNHVNLETFDWISSFFRGCTRAPALAWDARTDAQSSALIRMVLL